MLTEKEEQMLLVASSLAERCFNNSVETAPELVETTPAIQYLNREDLDRVAVMSNDYDGSCSFGCATICQLCLGS